MDDGHGIGGSAGRSELERLRRRVAELESVRAARAETPTRQRVDLLSWVVEQSTEGMAIADTDGVLLFVNRAWAEMHGFDSPEELIGRHLAIFHNDRQLAEEVEPFNRQVQKNGSHKGEVGHMRADGSTFPTLMTTTLLRDEDGTPVAIVGIAKDISDRRRAEEELRRERDRAEMYLDLAGVIIVAIDAHGRVELINREGCEILGWKEHEVVGRNWFEGFLPEHKRARAVEIFERLMSGELEPVEHVESTVLTHGGEERQIAWHNAVLRTPAGEIAGTISSGQDVTGQRRLEEQLRQSQKLEAVGQLAGGIAHDFNNILQAVFSHLSLMLQRMRGDDPLLDEVVGIKRSVEHAASLTRQLLAFGRRQVFDARDVDLSCLVAGLLTMLERVLGEQVELRFEAADEEAFIHADAGQVEQVLMNLCLNARDAMPHGGTITITTNCCEHWQPRGSAAPEVPAGPLVVLMVSDTGCGMDDETRQRAFEPFFSTKEVGQGSGLGLPTVYGIVTQHRGAVAVDSAPDEGTTFTVVFPRVERPPQLETMPPAVAARHGDETILVAEDDRNVASLLYRILTEAGYDVILAADGEHAVELFDAHQDEIDLALLDLVMPRVGGRQVETHIRRRRPELPVLFSTGYSVEDGPDGSEPQEVQELIQKPYEPEALLARIRSLLDASARDAEE